MNAPISARDRLMSMKEWLFDFSDEPFEFIDGEKIMWSPSVSRSNRVAQTVFVALLDATRGKAMGEPMMEANFAFTEDPKWVRRSLVPDVAFVSVDKLAAFRANYPNADEMPYLVVPDLAVEVISPTDRYANVKKKVSRYLEEGVPAVWVVDYDAKVVEAFTASGETELTVADTLTLPDIIPGLSLKVETFFS